MVGELPEVLRNINSIKQKRIAAFTFDRGPFESYSTFKRKLLDDGVCTIRFQNDRRARIVEIVPNQDQVAWVLVLMIFEALKKKMIGWPLVNKKVLFLICFFSYKPQVRREK